jgi:hypothetical protein
MYLNPHTHMAITQARHADLVREAEHRELARLVTKDNPSLLSRVRGFFGERSAVTQPVVRPV